MDSAGPFPRLTLVSKLYDEMGACKGLSATPNGPLRCERLGEEHQARRLCVLAGYPLQHDAFNTESVTKPLGLIVVSATNNHVRTRIEPHCPSFSGAGHVCG